MQTLTQMLLLTAGHFACGQSNYLPLLTKSPIRIDEKSSLILGGVSSVYPVKKMPILEKQKVSETGANQALSRCQHANQANLVQQVSANQDLLREDIAPICTGCRDGIFDQYFLSVSQEAWHCQCLKCSICGVILDSQMICYYKDGMILCKDDYYK
jgi:LIM domain